MNEVDVELDKALESLKRFTETKVQADFARFVRLSSPRMMAMLQQFMRGSSHEDREEVLNDAYLAVYTAVICPGTNAKPLHHISEKTWGYLKISLRNAASDRRKFDNTAKRKPDQPIVSTSSDETGNGGIDPPDTRGQDPMFRRVEFSQLQQLAEKLPQNERVFFHKRFLPDSDRDRQAEDGQDFSDQRHSAKFDRKQLQEDLGLSRDQLDAMPSKVARKLKILMGLEEVLERKQVTDLQVQIVTADQITDRLLPDIAEHFKIEQSRIRPMVQRVLGLINTALDEQGIEPVSINRTKKKTRRGPPPEEV
jgi:hypothetical protein